MDSSARAQRYRRSCRGWKLTEWQWGLLAAVVGAVCARLVWLGAAVLKERTSLSYGNAPSAEDIRQGMIPKGDKHFDWLVQRVRPKALAGTLQEEPIIAALEDRLI